MKLQIESYQKEPQIIDVKVIESPTLNIDLLIEIIHQIFAQIFDRAPSLVKIIKTEFNAPSTVSYKIEFKQEDPYRWILTFKNVNNIVTGFAWIDADVGSDLGC